jgi:hypothetical protein
MKWNKQEFIQLVEKRRQERIESALAKYKKEVKERELHKSRWITEYGPRLDELAKEIIRLRGPKKDKVVYYDQTYALGDARYWGLQKADPEPPGAEVTADLDNLLALLEKSTDDVVSSTMLKEFGLEMRGLLRGW